MKTCNKCQGLKWLKEFPSDGGSGNKDGLRGTCRDCYNENQRRISKENYDPRRKKKGHLKSLYGLTLEEYDALLASQDGACAICKKKPTTKMLAVDHDHNTNRVRGLLCSNCNQALGQFGDDPSLIQKAINYLERSNEKLR